jgi:hypothetical protein
MAGVLIQKSFQAKNVDFDDLRIRWKNLETGG